MTFVKDLAGKKQRVEQLLAGDHALPEGELAHVARGILEKREAILGVAGRFPTPFYMFDRAGLALSLQEFSRAFDAHLPGHKPFYAMKSNHHRLVVAEAVSRGYGLDVSSARELLSALEHEGCPILFSGPAKSADDLALALEHAERVTVQLDSFGELARLSAAAERAGRAIRAGVRVFTAHHGAWSKFGVPLGELPRFFREAARHPLVALSGVQFHLSWNRDPEPYRRIIEDLGRVLRDGLTEKERERIGFIDVGGGYRPHRTEGSYPSAHPLGELVAAADAYFGETTEYTCKHFVKPSVPVAAYAEAIGQAIRTHLAPLVDCAYYTEPGRVLSTFAMHLVLRVVDRKSDDLVIVDGGINMVGWERYLCIYCPVVNLTRPSEREIDVRLGGSLCDCEDVWGFHCYAERLEEGDVLAVPNQGAYSFSAAQEFIRPIPAVHELRSYG